MVVRSEITVRFLECFCIWILFRDYSTVDKRGCGYAFFPADAFFRFTITIQHRALNVPLFSEYQFFLYETIIEQREKDKTFNQIAEWLNEKGYLSVRGKRFRGSHVHSIVKKKRLKDEKLKRDYPEVRSDFSLEVVDKTILMSDFGFKD